MSGWGYRAVLAHPVAGRLAVADAVSVLGDFVGLGALLLLAYDRAGGAALGPASVFAVQALPALLAGTAAGPFLDRIGRRVALVGSYLAGAVAVLMPLLLPGLAAVLLGAALAPVTWVGLTAGALPETLAPVALSPAHRAWLPWALSAAPAGTAVAAILVGRSRLPERLRAQFRYLATCGVAFAATGLLLGRHPAFLLAGNLAVGLGSGWQVAAQTTFANLAPPQRMAQVTATMIASLIVLEGAGAVGFAWIAGRWGVSPAYLVVGTVLLVTGLTAQWRTPVELTAKGGMA